MDTDPEKHEAELLARLEAEREQRLAEKVKAGEVALVDLYVVAGSQTELRSKVEEAKASAIADLRTTGDQREVVFTGIVVVTGVCQHGEAADQQSEPWKPTVPPFFPGPKRDEVVKEEAEEPQPPVIETPICVQVRQCRDENDPGEIAEGYFSVDGKTVTVTNKSGGDVGSRTMLKGEDPRVVAKQLLREKSPEAEEFNRVLHYPSAGLA